MSCFDTTDALRLDTSVHPYKSLLIKWLYVTGEARSGLVASQSVPPLLLMESY